MFGFLPFVPPSPDNPVDWRVRAPTMPSLYSVLNPQMSYADPEQIWAAMKARIAELESERTTWRAIGESAQQTIAIAREIVAEVQRVATQEVPPADPKSDAETLTDKVVKDLGDGVFNRHQRSRIGDAVKDADRNANAGRAIGGGSGKGYGGLKMALDV